MTRSVPPRVPYPMGMMPCQTPALSSSQEVPTWRIACPSRGSRPACSAARRSGCPRTRASWPIRRRRRSSTSSTPATPSGELARERFADGVLVAEDYTQSAQALETTRRLLEDPPSAIFEAALEHGGVFVRPDALVRVGENLWDLYEVKSGTRVKDVNITDVAVQTWVLEGAGLPIRRAFLMHLDNTYVYDGGDYDLERLFVAEDVTAGARAYLPQVPGLVAEMLAMLDVGRAACGRDRQAVRQPLHLLVLRPLPRLPPRPSGHRAAQDQRGAAGLAHRRRDLRDRGRAARLPASFRRAARSLRTRAIGRAANRRRRRPLAGGARPTRSTSWTSRRS